MSIARQQNESAAQFEARATQQCQQALDAIVQIGNKCYAVGPNGRKEIEGAALLESPSTGISAVECARDVAGQVVPLAVEPPENIKAFAKMGQTQLLVDSMDKTAPAKAWRHDGAGHWSRDLEIESAINSAKQRAEFTPDQRDLRQLLAVKLRALATALDAESFKRPHAGEIRREVDRLRDIAGAME